MKKTITILLAIFFGSVLTAQQKIDSLRQLLSATKTDTIVIRIMNQIAHEFGESSPDSTLKYATEARRLSEEINYTEGEIKSTLNQAWAFTVTTNYGKALEYAFDCLKRSEALHDQELIRSSLWVIGGVYSFQEDHQQSLIYVLKILELFKNRSMDNRYAAALLNTGYAYLSLNRFDSSRYYLDRSLNAAIQLKDDDIVASANMNIGSIFLKQRQYDTAKIYFRKAMPVFLKEGNQLFIYSTAFFLAVTFDSTREYDSSMYYSQLALDKAKAMKSLASVAEISRQLSFLYKQTGKPDSALFFMTMAITAKDSLNSLENQKKIQTLTFTENLRQMEIAEQKKKDAETRKRNLELSGIAIFIPLFLLVVMLMGRRRVKSRTIEFLGILGLLFLFEFIVLLVHPYIGHWTHESPVWMLLILAAIAAVLIPLHHRSESWIKKKLSKVQK